MGWSPKTLREGEVPVRKFMAGRWYGPVGSLGTTAATENRARAVPMYWPGGTVDGIGCEVTTGADNSIMRLGIYADTGEGYPGSLVLDAGTVDASSTGGKSISTDLYLPPGLYWLVGVAQGGTPTLRSISTYSAPEIGTNSAASGSNGAAAYLLDGVTGELPLVFAGAPTTGLPAYRLSLLAG